MINARPIVKSTKIYADKSYKDEAPSNNCLGVK